jgi:DNA mismatch endonuclease (patch repair protein)
MDILTPEQRSVLMSRIRAKNTKPELIVRRIAHAFGYRFRLHCRDLPGSPDLVFPRLRKVIMVNGCFWHRHPGCRYAYFPKSNTKFWETKFEANVKRDRLALMNLEALGWDVLIIWECELKMPEEISKHLLKFLSEHE